MDFFLTIIILAISTFGMVAVLLVGRNLVLDLRFTSRALVNLVFFFALYKVVAYYGLPFLLNIFSDFRYVREDGVELLSLAHLYVIESISWIAWLAGLVMVAAWYKGKGKFNERDSIISHNESVAKWSLVILALGFVYYQYYRITDIESLFSESAALPWYLEITKSLLSYAGPPASVLLIVIGFKRWGWAFGFLGLMTFVVGFSTVSTRGALVYSIIFLAYVIFHFARSRKTYILLTLGFISLLVGYFVLGGLPSLVLSVADDQSLSVEAGDSSGKKGGRSALEEIEWRFGAASRMSTKFIDMYDRGDGAGINPIKNSFLGFLPRSINPDKPHPSTVDGDDIYSQGMYLLFREIHGYDTFSMVEFSTGGHAYWEFGWLGVLVLSAISGMYIGLCLYYFQSLGLVALPLLMATFKPWGYVDPKIWVSDIVVQIYQLILPLAGVVIIYLFVKKSRRLFA